ncbi:MAG: LysM peptidoglycan-binding domain-containing protein [Chitinophagales bacterium]
MASGKFVKMILTAYKESNFSGKVGEYEVQVNPETYNFSYSIEYSDDKQEPGSIGQNLKFKRINPAEVSFDFIFDGTGIVANGSKSKIDVIDDIEKFKDVVLKYNGQTHRTHYIKIAWGKVSIFQGVMTSLDITYKVFKSDGTPLRAVAKAKFRSTINKQEMQGIQRNNSPDLTHIRNIKAGDNLLLLTKDIYGTTDYYLQIARINKLKNFRALRPGTQIIFPPIDKTIN